MAMCGGRGRIGYFAKEMQLNKKYTIKEIKKFFTDNINEEDNLWGAIEHRKAKSIMWGLIRSECYDVEVFKTPKRVALKQRYVYRPVTEITQKKKRNQNKYNTLLSKPFSNIDLS